MKEITQRCAEDCHTMLLYPLDTDEKLNPAFTLGRIDKTYFLDKLDVTREDANKLVEMQKQIEPLTSELDKIFIERQGYFYAIQKSIDEFSDKTNMGINELEKLYKNPVKNKEEIARIIEESTKTLSDTTPEEIAKQIMLETKISKTDEILLPSPIIQKDVTITKNKIVPTNKTKQELMVINEVPTPKPTVRKNAIASTCDTISTNKIKPETIAIEQKTFLNKIQTLIKNNKFVFSTLATITVAGGIGIFLYKNKNRQNKKIETFDNAKMASILKK